MSLSGRARCSDLRPCPRCTNMGLAAGCRPAGRGDHDRSAPLPALQVRPAPDAVIGRAILVTCGLPVSPQALVTPIARDSESLRLSASTDRRIEPRARSCSVTPPWVSHKGAALSVSQSLTRQSESLSLSEDCAQQCSTTPPWAVRPIE
jgi:hypothetical protein